MAYSNPNNIITKGKELSHSSENKIEAINALEKALSTLNETIRSACDLGIFPKVEVRQQMSFYESNPDSIMGIIHYLSADSVFLEYLEMYDNAQGLVGMALPHGETAKHRLSIYESSYNERKEFLEKSELEDKKDQLLKLEDWWTNTKDTFESRMEKTEKDIIKESCVEVTP